MKPLLFEEGRGTIFYHNKKFYIVVGNWIDKHKNVIDMVKKEFNLPNNVIVLKDKGWDQGYISSDNIENLNSLENK